VTTAEIYLEHYRASFGNKMMWSPIIVTPPVMVAGIGGVFSRKWAKTYLPITAAVYTANGLLGEYYHARGVARRSIEFPLARRAATGPLLPRRRDGHPHLVVAACSGAASGTQNIGRAGGRSPHCRTSACHRTGS